MALWISVIILPTIAVWRWKFIYQLKTPAAFKYLAFVTIILDKFCEEIFLSKHRTEHAVA
jgi:hypothetical protein